MQFTLKSFCQSYFNNWLQDNKLLFEAGLVAISLQIALLPILWFIGWALPWPKPPIFTTIIEYELDNLQPGSKPKDISFKPKDIYEYRDPKLNQ